MHAPAKHRCVRCGAVLSRKNAPCLECALLNSIPAEQTVRRLPRGAGPLVAVWEFISGLGVPLDQLASLVVSAIWTVVLMAVHGPVQGGIAAFIGLVWPLAMIWFSDELGALTGIVRGRCINQETSPSLVKILGWLLLLLVIGHGSYQMVCNC